jgi:hypothetical protein
MGPLHDFPMRESLLLDFVGARLVSLHRVQTSCFSGIPGAWSGFCGLHINAFTASGAALPHPGLPVYELARCPRISKTVSGRFNAELLVYCPSEFSSILSRFDHLTARKYQPPPQYERQQRSCQSARTRRTRRYSRHGA